MGQKKDSRECNATSSGNCHPKGRGSTSYHKVRPLGWRDRKGKPIAYFTLPKPNQWQGYPLGQ